MKMTYLLTTLFFLLFFLTFFVPLTLPVPTTHPSHAGGQLCTLCSTSLLSTNSQDQNNALVEWTRYVIIRQTARGEPQYETRGEKEDQLGFIRRARWYLRMIFDVILGRSKWDLSMVQKRFSALFASISKGIGWGTKSACCLIWNWLGSLTRMIPTKSKTWETALSIALLAAFKSSWSRWSLGLRLRHWPFVQFDSGLSCFVCVLIIYCSNEPVTSSVVYWLDLCTDLNIIHLARYFSSCGHLCCPILAIIQILISPEQYFYSKCYWRDAIFFSNIENKLNFKTAQKYQ